MKYHRCDQIAADTMDAEGRAVEKFGSAVHLDVRMTERLVAFVSTRYTHEADFEQLLESALDANEPFASDAQRGGYKISLGIIFSRRKRHQESAMRQLEKGRPFAPR